MINNDLPDIQETKPKIEIPIQQVGVENVEVPFLLQCKFGSLYQTKANVTLTTNIDSDSKGISMSRLLLTLAPYLNKPLNHCMIESILKDLTKKVYSTNSFMRFEFELPIVKKSIISDNEFPLFYKCMFEGSLIENYFRFFQGVIVQYSSYCPCSAELSKHLVEGGSCSKPGFPHAQRSFAHISIETQDPDYVWLEDIINLVEKSIATLPYPIIKRIDEQEIARIASENPIFVEDAIRQISKSLNEKEEIYDWFIKCKHEESIHTNEAIAMNWKGVKHGFSSQGKI